MKKSTALGIGGAVALVAAIGFNGEIALIAALASAFLFGGAAFANDVQPAAQLGTK